MNVEEALAQVAEMIVKLDAIHTEIVIARMEYGLGRDE